MHKGGDTLIFNGIEKDYIVPLTGRRRSAWAPISRNLITVTGMPGAHLSHTDVQVRVITVPVLVKAENISDLQKVKENMAEWLVHDEPKELIFKDEQDRVYYAVVDGELELDEIFSTGRGEITFICPDPYKYGPEKTVEPETDEFIVENEGAAETYPIITLTAKEPTTFAMVSNGEEYMMVGRPYEIGETPVEKYPQVRRYNTDSLTGWAHMTQGYLIDDEVSGGTVSNSNIVVDNGRFTAGSYGSSAIGWYGPAIRTSLPESIQDFSVVLGARAANDGKGTGKVMAIFLDEDDRIVFSIGLINSRKGTKNMRVLARLNDGHNIRRRRIFDYYGDSGANSTDFSNKSLNIRLRREGNKFTAKTWQVRDGVQHTVYEESIIDDNPDFQRPIRQVVLFFAKYGNNPVFPMYISGLRVSKSNALTEEEIPYIAMPDDEIIFDHKTGDCYVNGESVPFDFGADFFTLKKGVNNLAVLPEDTFDVSIKYRERFK